MTLGEKIRDERKKHELSLDGLSARCGIDPATISKYERGALKPTEKSIRRIAAALEIVPEALMSDYDKPAEEPDADKAQVSKQAKCKSEGVTRWYSVDERKPVPPCLILGQNTTIQIVTTRVMAVVAADGVLWFNGRNGLREEDIKPGCSFRYWMPIPDPPTE